MSEDRLCQMNCGKISMDVLLRTCKPCTVILDKLPDTVFGGLRYENVKERAKIKRRKKIAMKVTQRSARRRGRARLFWRSVTKSSPSHDETPENERKPSRHLFTAFSEMLASLSPDGDTNFLLTKEETLIVGLLLELPNIVRAKVVEIAAKTCGWIRVNEEELSSEWLERLGNNGTISLASDFPAEFSTVLNALSVPELKRLCEKLGLSSGFPKPVLIRELSIAQICDVDIFQMPTDDDGIYDMRRIIRVEEPVRLLILKTAHLFLLPLRDLNYLREQSNPILKIVRPCLPLNPLLKSIKFDGYSEIFKNGDEFSRWAEAKQAKYTIEKAISRKKWNFVERRILEISMIEFFNISASHSIQTNITESFDTRPVIFRQFSEKFVMVEVLSRGVEALVSSGINLRLSEEVLHLLLRQPERSAEERCSWMCLLALIFEKMSSLEKAVDMAQHAWKLACGNCGSCKSKLTSLLKRLSHSQSDAYAASCEKMCAFEENKPQLPVVVIKRKSANKGFQGLKRVYNVIENGRVLHLSVEELVMNHFSKNGYPKGLDDEGRTLRNLCYLAIWEETYSTVVPHVFCAPWQTVPLDWDTPLFWITREKQLTEKLQKLSKMQPEEIALHLSEKKDSIGKVAGSVAGSVDWSLLDFDPTGMLTCLTAPLFATICTRLLSGGSRGFPDLILWNEEEKKCVFVEVKGPKDRLSSFQHSWLKFINDSEGQAIIAEVRE